MALGKRLRGLVVVIGIFGALSCGTDSTAPYIFTAPSFVKLHSDYGDWVGSGQDYSYTQADAVITLTAIGGVLQVQIASDQGWNGAFVTSNGRLEPGQYDNNLSWYGGNGCDVAIGWFSIDRVEYVDSMLTGIDLRFEEHCGQVRPGLHGTIHWRANDPTRPPDPIDPPPANLWQPPDSVLVKTGTYVYLESQRGDWVGQGQTWMYTPSDASFGVVAGGGLITFSVYGQPFWQGEFKAMNVLPDRLAPGYYGGIGRYPFDNPTKGGFDWFGDGRGCNGLHGWFAIDRIAYHSDTLTALDLRFEQHCEDAIPALHGVVH